MERHRPPAAVLRTVAAFVAVAIALFGATGRHAIEPVASIVIAKAEVARTAFRVSKRVERSREPAFAPTHDFHGPDAFLPPGRPLLLLDAPIVARLGVAAPVEVRLDDRPVTPACARGPPTTTA